MAIIEEEARAMATCFGVSKPQEAAASLVDRIINRLGGHMSIFLNELAESGNLYTLR
jgi:hypothetical protein